MSQRPAKRARLDHGPVHISLCDSCGDKLTFNVPVPADRWPDRYHPNSTRLARQVVNGVNADISEIEVQIAKAQKFLDSMTTLKSTLERSKLDYSSMLAVASTVPDDILTMIFEYVVEDQAQALFNSPPKARRTWMTMALSLSQTCRRWRQLALALPNLWRFITIDTTHLFSIDAGLKLISLFDLYISRAQHNLLDIRMTGRAKIHNFRPLEQHVLKYVDKFRLFHIRGTNLVFNQSHKLNAPNLQSLGVIGIPSQPRSLNLFNTPSVKHLHVTEMASDVGEGNWRNVESIHFDRSDPRDVVKLIGRCPKLKHIIFNDLEHEREWDDMPAELVVPSVTSLSIRSQAEGFVSDFISPFIFPKLIHLHVESSYAQNQVEPKAIMNLLTRSETNLQSLRLDYFPDLVVIDLFEIFTMSPAMTHLSILNYKEKDYQEYFSDEVLYYLTPTSSDEFDEKADEPINPKDAIPNPLLPNLTHLDIRIDEKSVGRLAHHGRSEKLGKVPPCSTAPIDPCRLVRPT
ncbi:hypothetical protein C8J56DRAFT_1075229 [Mycena floridula]|nr:hypothetical protein C8J56DRAFT_1075229 [Mycena floridula]